MLWLFSPRRLRISDVFKWIQSIVICSSNIPDCNLYHLNLLVLSKTNSIHGACPRLWQLLIHENGRSSVDRSAKIHIWTYGALLLKIYVWSVFQVFLFTIIVLKLYNDGCQYICRSIYNIYFIKEYRSTRSVLHHIYNKNITHDQPTC